MRKMARIDANHRAIVDLLRACGAAVQSLAMVGDGCPDILCGMHGRLALIEVKDGAKPPSGRRLTPAEVRWHEAWSEYPVYVVESDADVLALLAQMGGSGSQ